jgi:hypothetical protein
MTDQTRYRAPQRGAGLPQAPSSGAEGRLSRRGEDPLAELARLIGQEDPFADLSNAQRPTTARSSQQHSLKANRTAVHDSRRDVPVDARADQNFLPQPPTRPLQQPTYNRGFEDDDNFETLPPQRTDRAQANARTAYSYCSTRADSIDDQRNVSRAPASGQAVPIRNKTDEEYVEEYADYDEDPRDAHLVSNRNGYDDPQYARETADDEGNDDPRYARQNESVSRYEDDSYDRRYENDVEPEYAENEYVSDYTEEHHVEPSRVGRRWLIAGAIALAGCLIIGTAGLYGYRALVGKQRVENPPTIRSGDAPNKVVPQVAAQKEGEGQKLITDRVATAPGGERVVSREEQPANLSQSGRTVSAPADVQPQPPQATAFASPSQQTGAAQIVVPPSQQAAPAPIVNPTAAEPKRVRTMTVRADGTIVGDAASARATAPANQARSSVAPLALNPNSQATPEEQTADAQPAARQSAPKTSTKTTPAQNSQPWGGIAPQPAGQQQANYAPAGSYVVQVASQKTEADAQTAWRQMQARYTNVLANQQASIKRVDLGDRGTFYRAMVGPFPNRDQAYEMCQNLKAAGGECVVQRN